MNIEQLLRECDRLASRYYRLDSGSRERAARDWMQLKVRETALKIEQSRFKKPKMNKLHHGVLKIPHPDHTSDHT
jgi:hypothetical protein